MPAAILLTPPCCTSAWSARNWGSIFAVEAMLVLACPGVFMRRFGYSFVTLLIGFVLEPGFELSLRQSLILSGGSTSIFFTRPLPLTMLVRPKPDADAPRPRIEAS